jgi:tRNA(fMet)-specific endonuclease VapC
VHEFLRRVDILPWDTDAAQAYANARATLQAEGRTLAPMDLLIGAHALAIGAVLVTNDHAFAQLPGVVIEDWTEAPR